MFKVDYDIPEIALEKDPEDKAKIEYLKWRFLAILEHKNNRFKEKNRS